METRVALISIIVEDIEAAEKINHLLHNYRQYIIGRMGLPYRPKKISIISIAIDGPMDEISALTVNWELYAVSALKQCTLKFRVLEFRTL